jgi:hypothetical protein
MSSSTSNLSVNEQHVTATATKRKEGNVAATATVQREQEALVAVMATARKTLDEVRVHECTTALAWEKEKTITRHLEQHLTASQGIMVPQEEDVDRSIDTDSNPDAIHHAGYWYPEHTIGGHNHSRTLVTPLQAVARSRASHASSIRLG